MNFSGNKKAECPLQDPHGDPAARPVGGAESVSADRGFPLDVSIPGEGGRPFDPEFRSPEDAATAETGRLQGSAFS